MKKILALAVGMLLIPFTAFGMQMMSDSDMDSITGQSGVAISLDNIQIYSNSGGSELWYETFVVDGTGTAAAAVGLVYGDSPSYLFINKIGAPGYLGAADGTLYADYAGPLGVGNDKLRGDYSALSQNTDGLGTPAPLRAGITNKGPRQNPSVLSIRVAQHNATGIFGLPAGTDYMDSGAYVEIGLPTLEIYSAAGGYDTLKIYVLGEAAYDGDNPIGSGAHQWSLGTIYTTDSGSTTAILGGRIGITSLGQIPQEYTSSGLTNDLEEGPSM